ncbi:hypothetical protein ACIP5Y_42940 [Nocardia sp. NPDC088792]|uniref:hypothetical protein n=1 Tax=Nocardia sp. NPDC088792 TaxID=3364332 RepID=UPI0038057A6A
MKPRRPKQVPAGSHRARRSGTAGAAGHSGTRPARTATVSGTPVAVARARIVLAPAEVVS